MQDIYVSFIKIEVYKPQKFTMGETYPREIQAP